MTEFTPYVLRSIPPEELVEIDIKGYQKRYTAPKPEEPEPVKMFEPEKTTPTYVEGWDLPVLPTSSFLPDFKRFKSKKEFVDTLLPLYQKELKKQGLNEEFAKSLVAQDGLESSWGSAPSGDYNFGGIKLVGKGTGTTTNTTEYENGVKVKKKGTFRNFANLEDYVKHKIWLLGLSRYNVFNNPVSEFIDRVVWGGYATDPNYASKLRQSMSSLEQGGIIEMLGFKGIGSKR